MRCHGMGMPQPGQDCGAQAACKGSAPVVLLAPDSPAVLAVAPAVEALQPARSSPLEPASQVFPAFVPLPFHPPRVEAFAA